LRVGAIQGLREVAGGAVTHAGVFAADNLVILPSRLTGTSNAAQRCGCITIRSRVRTRQFFQSDKYDSTFLFAKV
jgi:hypothetical protein